MKRLTMNSLSALLSMCVCLPTLGCLGVDAIDEHDFDDETEHSALTLRDRSIGDMQFVAESFSFERPTFPGGADEIYDPDASGCSGTFVDPEVATDGQRIYLDEEEAEENMRVMLTGYRYNDAPPTKAFPSGEGREAVYCGCRRVLMEVLESGDPEFTMPRPYFIVPEDAPSGDYTVELLPASGDCASGGIRATCEPPIGCDQPTLSVVPSYVVSTMERLDINNNSEPNDNHPAEMAFIFGGGSGEAFGSGERFVEWSGSFPGWGHITNADHTTLNARVPLFVGDESLMTVGECLEECVASPASSEAGCTAQCESDQSLGRYSNRMDFGIGGFENDTGGSEIWAIVAGVAATAVSCWAATELGHPCFGSWEGLGGSAGIGSIVGAGVSELLEDDDDDLGHAEVGARQTADWNVGPTLGPIAFSGPSGDIGLYYRTQRLPAPRILSYSVRLLSVTVTDNYEEDDCSPPNEVFVNARAHLHQGESGLPATIRIPDGDAVLSLNEGDTHYFGPTEGLVSGTTYHPETAPESPFLFVELGVWEDDDSEDLMGIHADTIPLGEYLSFYMDESDDTTSEGYFVRHATFTRSATVHGYAGSDEHCWSWWEAHGWDPDGIEGGARLEYEVELTWLKANSL